MQKIKPPAQRKSLTRRSMNSTKARIQPPSNDTGTKSIKSESAKDEGDATDEVSENKTEALLFPQISSPPPWPEWSDKYINDETWTGDANHPFEDSSYPGRVLHLSHHHTWMRPVEFAPTTPAVVKLNSAVLDLITPNALLCEKSELIRYILSEVSELYEYSLQNVFAECEGEGVAYVPNYGEDNRWTPWSHIYSCCKAGVRGEKPAYNPNGLYYVRLYFMGAWRRIAVDDRIPVLTSGHSGLPLTDTNELWPMLLSKALLKIAAITWNDFDGKRFSVISALTGWVFEWVDSIEGVNEEELWIDLANTLPKYSDPKRIPSCYTLLKPSHKKKLLPEEGNDTWWMPNSIPHPSNPDDTAFVDVELEPLQQSGEKLKTFMEIEWTRLKKNKRKAAQNSGPNSGNSPTQGTTVGNTTSADTGKETAPTTEEKSTGKKPNNLNFAISNIAKKGNKKKLGAVIVPMNKKGDKSKKREQDKNDATEDHPNERSGDQSRPVSEKGDVSMRSGSISIGATHWSTIKGLVLGLSHERMLPRKSKSFTEIFEKQDEEVDNKVEEYRDAVQAKTHAGIPSIFEILYGVQKFSGIDHRSKIRNWEILCGKDSPIALVVVLKVFPRPEDCTEADAPAIPSFLQHPIQLTEIRDTALQKVDEDRPQTPLWKRFRWKAWAMKKGLIPMEEHTTKSDVHAIKAKTPFVFKTDWYKYTPEEDDIEVVYPVEWLGEHGDNEYDGEGADYLPPGHFAENHLHHYNQNDIDEEEADSSTVPPLTQQDLLRGSAHHTRRNESRTSITSSRPRDRDSLSHSHDKRKSSTDKRVSLGEEKSLHQRSQPGSQTMILYESEYAEGDSEEEGLDESLRLHTPIVPASTPAVSVSIPVENAAPHAACATVWFECADVAKNLRKFCKFYKTQSVFGSCYILRREPNLCTPVLDPVFQEIPSTLPQYPEVINEFKQRIDGFSYSVDYDRFKSYNVTDYHLNEREGIDSGFYLYSDSWTEQELIITVELLQEDLLKNLAEAPRTPRETVPAVPPPTANLGTGSLSAISKSGRSGSEPFTMPAPPNTLHLIVEPWSWKRDNCRCEPLISATIDEYWITHVRLPPGRNTFRIWLLLQNENDTYVDVTGTAEVVGEDGESIPNRRTFVSIPFSVRLVSQTPIYLGSRIEVQNYMTNVPVLMLKQAERLANCVWGVFACFGRKLPVYRQSLEQLRRSYCPKAPEPKMINTHARGVHDTFENLFVALVTFLNGGYLDKTMILALQVLFLDPRIGHDFKPVHHTRRQSRSHQLEYTLKKSKYVVLKATETIQRYFRGWLVRRLFQMRLKGHREFKKIEYNVRRIAFLLAKETESVFSHSGEYKKNDRTPDFNMELDKAPLVTPSILPKPPHWSVDFIRYILEAHPWIINVYPHMNCSTNHIKIQEFQGQLPALKEFSKCPFFKKILTIPKGSKECFCEIDLQVYPSTGIYLKLTNNDTRESSSLVNNRLFIGTLPENQKGYTLQCYRWAFPGMYQDLTDRAPSNAWKIRVISVHNQVGPIFKEINESQQKDSFMDDSDQESSGEEEAEICIENIIEVEYYGEEGGEGTEEDEMEDEEEENESINEEEEELSKQSEAESLVPELK